MTRIVSGAAKGRRLEVPSQGTRPTSDRAREALFNSLAALLELDGERVLDLFAGSGAVGLEALSRGAAAAVLVESDRRAADVVARNVETVGRPGATVVRRPVLTYLATDAAPGGPFGFVFADPPYALAEDQVAAVLAALGRPGWLADDGIVVIERGARGPAPQWPDVIEPLMERRYGEGVLWYGRRAMSELTEHRP
jgi:16S rRNA (guanine966-N2)-methyltransferase